jgi:signal transduction histidine kinase
MSRRSLTLPITLAVVMIVLLVVLTVGWVWLTVLGISSGQGLSALYWTVLPIGTTFLVVVLAGVIVYLTLSIKAINLTRRQSNFIDSVTHELKSPIAALKLYLQTLNRQDVSGDEREEFYRFMLEDIERLDLLINHVLDAGRLEKPTIELTQQDVEMASLLEMCAETVCLRYRVPAKTVRLDLEKCVVQGQPVELDMIFRNLIDNAVKYAGDEPEVEVSLRTEGDGEIVVRIADNGPGIPFDARRKVFGRFVRLGKELERQTTGTGLGLYIVATLVRRMRGKVDVQSRLGRSGTVFEVRLPRRPAKQIGDEAGAEQLGSAAGRPVMTKD